MTFLGPLGGLGKTLIMFLISVIIAGVFLIKADASAGFVRKLVYRLVGERSDEIIPVTGGTIQNVAIGILLGIKLFFVGLIMLKGGSAVRSMAKG
jgi:hypothetical protein